MCCFKAWNEPKVCAGWKFEADQNVALRLKADQRVVLSFRENQRTVLCCTLGQTRGLRCVAVCSEPKVSAALKLGATKSLHCVEPEVWVVLRRTRGVCCVDSCGEPALCVLLNLGQTKGLYCVEAFGNIKVYAVLQCVANHRFVLF